MERLQDGGSKWTFIDSKIEHGDNGVAREVLWVSFFFENEKGIVIQLDFNFAEDVVNEYGDYDAQYRYSRVTIKPERFAHHGIDKLIEQYEPLARILS